MTKLNQILGIRDGVKNRVDKTITALHRTAPAAYQGISGVYHPLDETDVTYPPESTLVQVRATQVMHDFSVALAELVDVVATTDNTNMAATADIVLSNGTVIATGVPAVTLLFLEKKVEDMKTFVSNLPTLDPSENWTWDSTRGVYVSDPVQSFRMKKVPKAIVLYAATKEHPAQVQAFSEDLPVGTWTRTKFSGALPQPVVRDMLERIEAVRMAVVFARNQANMTQVSDLQIGAGILDYVFASH